MKVTRPHQLPEFRLWLLTQWLPGELFWSVAQFHRHDNPLPNDEWVNLEAGFDSNALPEAQLFWVSPEMCALVDRASRTLPPTTLTKELMPAPEGLVWFEEPLIGMPAQDVPAGLMERGETHLNESITVRAIVWGTSLIPPGPHEAIGISTYTEVGKFMSPAGRSDWEWGVDSDEPIDERIADDKRRVESMAEDRRWMATFWLLLSQTGIADTSIVRPLPKVIRAGKRKAPGITAAHFNVRVVNVHAPKRPAEVPSSELVRHVDWSHRWIVQPFWRQQAYGPNHSLRRPMLIGPYIKGPADKPLIVKETVHVLRGSN